MLLNYLSGNTKCFPPRFYPYSIVNKDFGTQRIWIGKYEADCYIMFAYESAKINANDLPKWVNTDKKYWRCYCC